MYYLTNYLIYIAVLVRAAGWIQDSAPIPLPAWILFVAFGILLISERAVTRFLPWYPRLYILVQSCMVIAMLYSAPQADIFAMLFFPLSFQAVRYFSASIGFCFIAAYSAAMAGSLLFGMEFQPWIVMLLFSTGVNVMLGSFAMLIERTDRSLLENQRLFGELQEAFKNASLNELPEEVLHSRGDSLHLRLHKCMFKAVSANIDRSSNLCNCLQENSDSPRPVYRIEFAHRPQPGSIDGVPTPR
jgi:hypothetical protein